MTRDTSAQTFVLLHGFTGAPASWDPLVARLPPNARVARPALSGHGPARSPSWSAEVDRLLALLDAESMRGAHLVGYSMGGRVAWGLLAADPTRFCAATLIGAHPGLSDPAARRRRHEEDARRAEQLEREGLDAFLDAWASLPMWASQRALDADTLAAQDRVRRAHTADGLAHALRVLGLAQMPALDPRSLRVPITLVTGALDAKHRALADALVRRAPNLEARSVEGCGHNVLLERPDALARLLTEGSP